MASKIVSVLLCGLICFSLTACGPPKIDKVIEISPNETAFVVPLEGDTSKQGKFMSENYLEKNKVAAKRIYLPLTKIKTGRYWWSFKWAPTVKVISVDRKPVTFVWEKVEGIHVESRDSIGFIVGINVTAHVDEQHTAKFLYHFPSGDLKKTINNVVKSEATEILSREFAKYDLEGEWITIDDKKVYQEGSRQKKGEIVDLAKEKLRLFFEGRGVTIDTFGLIGGLDYEDHEIQQAINNNFKSELDIKNRENERLAQEKVNQKKIDMATAEKTAAVQFALAAKSRTEMVNLEIKKMLAQAELEKAENWDGKLPSNIIPQGSGFILSMDNGPKRQNSITGDNNSLISE